MKAGRPSISINGAVGRRLAARCEADGVSMSHRVEQLINDVVSGLVPIPRIALARGRAACRHGPELPSLLSPEEIAIEIGANHPPTLRGMAKRPKKAPADPELRGRALATREQLDEIAAARRLLAEVRAAEPVVALSATVALDVSDQLAGAIEDLLERAGDAMCTPRPAAPGEVTAQSILDRALTRMLDHMERVPWCRACLEPFAECRCSGSAQLAAALGQRTA